MQPETILLFLVLFVVASYRLGRQRSLATAGGERPTSRLHSLPSYYGYFTAIWCLLPGLAVISIWLALEPRVITAMMVERLPEAVRNLSPGALDLAINDIRNLAAGELLSRDITPALQEAANRYREWSSLSNAAQAVLRKVGDAEEPAHPFVLGQHPVHHAV